MSDFHKDLQRMVDICRHIQEGGNAVRLKADGSVPATLELKGGKPWSEDELKGYLVQEFMLGNFRDVLKRKGYGSIFLTDQYASTVAHFRVFQPLADYFTIHQLD